MKRETRGEGPGRLGREDWIALARKVLVQSGIEDVKVVPLADRMQVTRGSFYWHFANRKDLLDALLSDWEVRNYFEIAQVRGRWARSEPNLSEVLGIWLGEDPSFPAFDIAIRNWARKAANVAETTRRVDDAWIALLKELFLRSGYGDTESFVRARVAYFHQVGYYALALKEDLHDRLQLSPYYYKALTGFEAPANLVETLTAQTVAPAKGRRRKAAEGADEPPAEPGPAPRKRMAPA